MRLLVLAVIVTSLAVGAGPTPAQVTPGRCQGEPATMIGAPTRATVVGTEGRDVIISNGSDVDARGGADVICVSGGSTYVDGGDGRDSLRIHAVTDATMLSGGSGTDTLDVVARVVAPWTIDVPLQRISTGGSTGGATGGSTGGASAAITDLEHYRLGGSTWSSLVFSGGPGADLLDLTGETHPRTGRPLSVDLGPGNDTLRLLPGQADPSEYLFAGRGRDAITLVRPGKRALRSVFGSTRHHSYSIDGTVDAVFLGFENIAAENFSEITLEAGNDDNVLRAVGCQARLTDSSGDDVLRFVRARSCRPADRGGATMQARYGDDLLIGSTSDDTLDGGSGRDVARGGDGTDRCVAEVRRGCES